MMTPMLAGNIAQAVEALARAAMGRDPVVPARTVKITPSVEKNWGLVPDKAGDGGSVG